ncbi:tryptophan--tRNA ligase [Dactylosporangium sp. NPDC049525]|uniref:tryptophan--tRNA ligase n=1 Tax=Dactylosporangium sp. NPDC049525 TaxID=3154730 RepID=UPI00342EB0F8
MSRRISGFKPTGPLQLGNYVGAIRPVVRGQHEQPTVVFIADLHALTVPHDPALVQARSREVAGLLLAAGVDPGQAVLYRQSDVAAHLELHYLLECVASYGEAHRMIQFKEKGGGGGSRLSLLTYPVLMAADILLHDIEEVPVGHDQRQHVELTRDLAERFNERYGPTFTVPRAVHPAVAARIADLAEPARKMGKTNTSTAGVLFLLDPPDVLRRKVMRAVTDAGTEVVYDPQRQPGVANLLDILGALSDRDPRAVAGEFHGTGYGELKKAVADAVIATLEPIRRRYQALTDDDIETVLAEGAERAARHADQTVRRARIALGLTGGRRAPAGSPATPVTAGRPR